MSTQLDILLVTQDAPTIGAVASSLHQNGQFAANCVCRDLSSLVKRLEVETVSAVLVDIDENPTRTLAALEPIIGRFPGTRFIVLASNDAYDLMLAAMQAGARHLLVKRNITTDLPSIVARLTEFGAPQSGRSGEMFTVLSASGGCGATTVAVNLANELHLLNDASALIVDLDCCYGAVASYLGITGEYGLADLLSNRERIDSQLVSTTAQAYAQDFHVLLGPATTRGIDGESLSLEYLPEALNASRRAYRYTVLDAPRLPFNITTELCVASRMILLVFQLTVKDVRQAQSMLSALVEAGVPTERIMPVANRCGRRNAMVTSKEADAALGGFSLTCIANDFSNAIRSTNYGQPLNQAAPRSALRRDLRQLAALLSEAATDYTTIATIV